MIGIALAVDKRHNMVVLGERRPAGVVGERLVVWGWLAAFGLSAGLFWLAWSGSHGQQATVGGRTVTNLAAATAQAGQDALARGAAADPENDPLACYFSDPGPAYLSCGPVILDGSLHKGWDNFTVTSQPVGIGVRAEPVDGTVMVGSLGVGTRLVSGGGVLSRVGADQSPYNVMYTTAAWKAGFVTLGFAVLWAFASVVTSGSRRNRKAALAAVAVDRDRAVSVRQSWDSIGMLAVVAPVVPPVSVYREAPAQADGWPVDAETGEILDDEVEAKETAAAVSAQIAGPAADTAGVAVEQLAITVDAGEDGARAVWPGPAMLVLGVPLMVGAVVEPDRKVVVELAAYLACHRDGLRSAEQIQAALWPLEGSKGDVSLDTVRQHLSRLRRSVGEENFPDAAKAGGYGLGEGVSCDWLRFQALAEAARRSEGVRSAGLRREALGLVRGAPFAGVAKGTYGWAWEELIVAAMEAAITDVAHRLAVELLADGQARLAEWAASRGLLAVPTDETLLADRMTAAREFGGRPGLDRAWRDAKAVLGEQAELGPLAEVYARLTVQ